MKPEKRGRPKGSFNTIGYAMRPAVVHLLPEDLLFDANLRHDRIYGWHYAFPHCYFNQRGPECVTAPPGFNKGLDNKVLDKMVLEWHQHLVTQRYAISHPGPAEISAQPMEPYANG